MVAFDELVTLLHKRPIVLDPPSTSLFFIPLALLSTSELGVPQPSYLDCSLYFLLVIPFSLKFTCS